MGKLLHVHAVNSSLGLHEGRQRHALLLFFFSWLLNRAAPLNTVSEQRGLGVISTSPGAAHSSGGLRLIVTSRGASTGTFPPVLRGTLPLTQRDSCAGRLPQAPSSLGGAGLGLSWSPGAEKPIRFSESPVGVGKELPHL